MDTPRIGTLSIWEQSSLFTLTPAAISTATRRPARSPIRVFSHLTYRTKSLHMTGHQAQSAYSSPQPDSHMNTWSAPKFIPSRVFKSAISPTEPFWPVRSPAGSPRGRYKTSYHPAVTVETLPGILQRVQACLLQRLIDINLNFHFGTWAPIGKSLP